jgi:hypothetical protein
MRLGNPSSPRVHVAAAGRPSASETSGYALNSWTIVLVAAAATVVVGAGASLGPKQAVGAVVAVAAGLYVARRPVVGAYTLVALAPALSGIHRGLPIPGLRLTEVMIAGIAAIILITAKKAPRWGAFDWCALAYVLTSGGLVWLNVVRHGSSFSQDILGTLFGPVQYLLLYRAIVTALPEPEQRARAVRLVLFTSVPVSLVTLMQQFNLGPTRAFLEFLTGTNIYESTVGEVPRATGPFPHWHNLGGYLFLVLLLGFSLLLENDQRVIRRRVLLFTLAPACAALIQTASFAPLFGAVAGALVIGFSMGQGRRVLAWIGVTAVIIGLLFGPLLQERIAQQYRKTTITQDQTFVPQTIAFRYRVWKSQYIPTIEQNLATGFGPTLPPNHLYFAYAESLYVTLLLRGGLPLLVAYLALMIALAVRARRAALGDEMERRMIGRVVFASVPLLMVIDLIATYFLDSGPAPLLWTLAGLMGVGSVARAMAHPQSNDDRTVAAGAT